MKTNIDWAGVMVERATGMSLNDYCQSHIFAPLGVKNISFFPTAEMKSKLVHMAHRAKDGTLTPREHPLRLPLITEPGSAEQKSILNSAGAGCFAQPSEYVKIIAALLNDGTSPTTGTQILKPETVAQMFENQIPHMPNFGREKIQAAIPELTNEIGELYPQPHDQPQGWGLTFMLTISEGATGRGRSTGWWAGLPNLFWWADRERGVGGMVASQILPFAGELRDALEMGLVLTWCRCSGDGSLGSSRGCCLSRLMRIFIFIFYPFLLVLFIYLLILERERIERERAESPLFNVKSITCFASLKHSGNGIGNPV
jgi:CubicO group peptidase (beta-lactamase class C family)